jgi:hypothetical protein
MCFVRFFLGSFKAINCCFDLVVIHLDEYTQQGNYQGSDDVVLCFDGEEEIKNFLGRLQ